MAGARKRKAKPTRKRETFRARKPINWVHGARKYLHRLAKVVRANGNIIEAYELLFANKMILDCWNFGKPGLLVGMIYTSDWRAWRDVTAHPKQQRPDLPSADDLDRIAEEVESARMTER